MSSSTNFSEAVANSSKIKSASNEEKLKLYSLYKQGTIGRNRTQQPGMFDLVGTAKWDAWNSLRDMSMDDAQKNYVTLVNGLLGVKIDDGEKIYSQSSGPVLVSGVNRIRIITWNRPEKKNAMNEEMYVTLTKLLRDFNNDETVDIVVITGSGDYFCSGNDLGNFMSVDMNDKENEVKKWIGIIEDHIASYIDFKKILIGIVNGPAVGLGVTSLPFFDAVFATERATFNTPFTALGQTPEACSSFFLPRIMGYAKATQMLLFGTKITAREAEQCGLITEIFPDDVLKSNAWDRIHKMAELPINALLHAKELLRGRDRDLLHHVNKTEMVRMKERVNSEDCMDAVLKFFARKTKK
ncbi:enoyl-CoA delta isomerase 2 [Folsomia candida]|uniref:enoyl-CoA delta isomerase 2 n=1 Tax=Folsomia candida TaxID=158441 RepID=UPI000B8F53CF|nr:enoyl-CoA delta isomerase 2 [Folsomia candida]